MKTLLSLPLLLAALATLAASAAPLKLHVPSPDWRDQVIYFVMTDRFADGDPRNNDQGVGAYDPRSNDRFNGGDIAGLRQRLDYIQGLGATALWLTPPVRNQWLDPTLGFTGYHGYWAQHFKQVDPHIGTLADYQGLSHDLHSRGMYLVQDIVVNHVGNYFGFEGGWDAADPTQFYTSNTRSRPTSAPTQWPFNLNDPRRAVDARASVYHWTPPLIDVKNPLHELTHQMSGLDDLNTSNPVVMRALRDSYGYWIKTVGVDAFRVDTAFYVEPEFFADFMHSRDARAPGMAQVARQTGRRDFLAFGEGFALDRPFDDTQARKIERYMTGDDGRPRLPGMLNFPLYGALGDVFARGRAPAELGHRISAMPRLHARPHRMPSFLDNHDVDRFLAGGSQAALKQALLAQMTLPGIPVIYYGTEQGFTLQRPAMFAAGWGSDGRDHFDTAHPLYRYTARTVALRREHRLFSRGLPKVLRAAAGGAGALAWRTDHAGQAALVVFNTADDEVLLDALAPGLPAGTALRPLFGIDTLPPSQRLDHAGRLTLRLPPRAGWVWAVAPQPGPPLQPPPLEPADTAPLLTLDPLPQAPLAGDFTVTGTARGVDRLWLVLDGRLAAAREVVPGSDGRWQAQVDTAALVDPALRHRLVAYARGPQSLAPVVSTAGEFRVERDWQLLADIADPAGDDHGPDGDTLRYDYPTDPSFAPRQMDLRRVQVWGGGGALRVDLAMAEISTTWAPANGFDHVAFTLFVELPGETGGSEVMPFQDGPAPLRWHRRLRAHGWSNALFASDGASAAADGRPMVPAATVRVDRAARTVSFVLPAASLGQAGAGAAGLSGARLYINTWDYDGGYRPLRPAAEPYAMGGGGPGAPKVMDDLPVITLP